jgi:bifunctional non-homologous end joining protein LigD
MLATLVHDAFSHPNWIYERKLDGERCLAFCNENGVRLLSRSRKELNISYPEVAEALTRQGHDDLVLDGEVVAFEGSFTSFSRLQRRMQVKDPNEARAAGVAVYYYVFDVLQADGLAVEDLPQRERKKLLRKALSFSGPLRYCGHRNESGETYFREACRKGWEGLIAKEAGAPYAHSRSRKWLKFKCIHEQELVIGGFTDPKGSRKGFGALLVGFYHGDHLRYAGKVGTGFDDETLVDLREKLSELERPSPAFKDVDPFQRGVHWVEPQIVGQFGFTEWTEQNRLRHPRFLGLRRDKEPRDVSKEQPS